MPTFFEDFDGDVFVGSALDALSLEGKAKRRFVKEFRAGWIIARSGLD
jgi:hypothetical protein